MGVLEGLSTLVIGVLGVPNVERRWYIIIFLHGSEAIARGITLSGLETVGEC